MCGICGILSHTPIQLEKEMIKKMCDKIYHRGPDSEGYFIGGNIALGMRRLKIIDLESGDQPIFNEDGSLCVVLNGEIYNYQALREELLERRHRFSTQSDTEVIVHLYEEFGDGCLEKLQGMFAFALWDNREKKLFIARDRLGIKPLYYSSFNDKLLFSSELKSILTVPNFKREIDFTSLSDYFSFLYVPAPRTIFKGIKKLLPGHYIVATSKGINVKKYWDLAFTELKLGDTEEYVDKFFDVFNEAVKLHLVSDVPLGAFLSGGIDSSLVVGTMTKFAQKPIETFSIGYEQKEVYFDERKYARIVANKFNTHHHEFLLKPNDVFGLIEKIVSHFDEPFADASALPNYLIAEKTRQFVTVSLTGLGGDELCAGYERYLGNSIAEKYQRLPKILTEKIISPLINNLPDSRKGKHFNERLKRFVHSASLPFPQRYFQIIAKYNDEDKEALFLPEVKSKVQRASKAVLFDYDNTNGLSDINRMSLIDLKTYLADDLLTLTDRMSMAHSLEARVPFIDHKVVEFFASVPVSLKMKGLTKKYLLKRAAERLLPKQIIYRKKMGFSVPLVLWLRNEMQEYVHNFLSEQRLKKIGYFDAKVVFDIKKRHLRVKSNFDEKLWALLIFVKWYEQYME